MITDNAKSNLTRVFHAFCDGFFSTFLVLVTGVLVAPNLQLAKSAGTALLIACAVAGVKSGRVAWETRKQTKAAEATAAAAQLDAGA